MARNGLFGGRTEGKPVNSAVDRDGDGVDDRDEPRNTRVLERDQEPVLDREPMIDRDGVDDRTEAKHALVPDTNRDGVDDRVDARDPVAPVSPVTPGSATPGSVTPEPVAPAEVAPAPVRVAPARASMLATLGLMLGLVGVAATLTGRLAPAGIVLGVVGLLLSLGGVRAGAKSRVAGRGLGLMGLLLSAAAIVLAIFAMRHTASWLDSNVDQVAKLRTWLDLRMPWMRNW